MATWGLHMRVAEQILQKRNDLDEEGFIVGNIGADCGVPNEDWSIFTPNTDVTHWKVGENREIRPDLFLAIHLSEQCTDKKEYSFLLGYYVHLLTDVMFSEFISGLKESNKAYEPLKTDPKYIWTIKKDWYDLDHKYFRDNPNNLFSSTFRYVRQFPDYLDYYPTGAVQRQVDYITDFYSNPPNDLDRAYVFLNEEMMSAFVEKSIYKIMKQLS